jgi:hypothetical protein
MTDIKKSLLEEAETIINGNRRQTYGEPEQNFERIALLWNAWLSITEQRDAIEPREVALMMTLVKLARLAETPDHRDSIVDMIGYAACYGELVLAKQAEPPPITKDDFLKHMKEQGLSEYLDIPDPRYCVDTPPVVPRRDDAKRKAFIESAKIGSKVQYQIEGGYLETGRVTDIDDFHAWMRLKIDDEWVANDRIMAIL